jgi:hypothetical protein
MTDMTDMPSTVNQENWQDCQFAREGIGARRGMGTRLY